MAGISGEGLMPPPNLPSMRNMNKSDLAKSLMAVIPSCPVKGCQQAWSY